MDLEKSDSSQKIKNSVNLEKQSSSEIKLAEIKEKINLLESPPSFLTDIYRP
jgi:hypothetical protein